jgi:hypothetical protein
MPPPDVTNTHRTASSLIRAVDILAGPEAPSVDDEPILIPDHDYPPEMWHDADRE